MLCIHFQLLMMLETVKLHGFRRAASRFHILLEAAHSCLPKFFFIF